MPPPEHFLTLIWLFTRVAMRQADMDHLYLKVYQDTLRGEYRQMLTQTSTIRGHKLVRSNDVYMQTIEHITLENGTDVSNVTKISHLLHNTRINNPHIIQFKVILQGLAHLTGSINLALKFVFGHTMARELLPH